jgi:hypothetical protein
MIRRAAGAVVLHGDACLLVHKVKVMDGPGGLLSHQESRDFFEGGAPAALPALIGRPTGARRG